MFNYLMRLFYGLPLNDSRELIAAKNYRPHRCPVSPPKTMPSDQRKPEELSSAELEEAAAKIYTKANKSRK